MKRSGYLMAMMCALCVIVYFGGREVRGGPEGDESSLFKRKLSSVPASSSSSRPTSNPGEMSDQEAAWLLREDNERVNLAAEAAKDAKEAGLRLVPGSPETNKKYTINVRIKVKNVVVSEDTIEALEGHWNVVESKEFKKYAFLMSQTDKKDVRFLAFSVVYVVNGQSYMLMSGETKIVPTNERLVSLKGGMEDTYLYEVTVNR